MSQKIKNQEITLDLKSLFFKTKETKKLKHNKK